MKREKIEETTRVIDRALTSGGKAVVFSYEVKEGIKTKSCEFSVHEGEEGSLVLLSGRVSVDENYMNIYFDKALKAGVLAELSEVLHEVEKILSLETQEDEASTSE